MTREEALKDVERVLYLLYRGRIAPNSYYMQQWKHAVVEALQEPERKHGKWIRRIKNFGCIPTEFSYCSICESMAIGIESKYCPHCGAIMDGDEKLR